MSRLELTNKSKAQDTVNDLYSQVMKKMAGGPDALCPVDVISAFLKLSKAQSCGKCVPCRIGLSAMEKIIDNILDCKAKIEDLTLLRETAESVYISSDCAIGTESAKLVIKALDGFYDDFVSHIEHGKCLMGSFEAVPCRSNCPAGVDIPGYIACVKEGKYQDAIKVIRKDNPLPLVCGLICEHPCEHKCRRSIIDSAINIRGLKRYAVENAGEVDIPKNLPSTNKTVAIVGGGPSGLTAGYYLSLMGHKVTIFEEKSKLGGMLRYGIPAYRLPREQLDKEINDILKTGITVKLNTKIGQDIKIEDLKKNFDAIYLAIGAQTDKKLGIDGEDAKGVISAVDMLRDIGDDKMPNFEGKNVVVVGGGNVAMDVARSSIRLNAKSVKIVYRRRIEDMTALPEEVAGAMEEGCIVMELYAPVSVKKNADGSVNALIAKPQIIGEYDRGRPKPVNSDEPELEIPCDIILIAIGQNIDSEDFEKEGIPTKRGSIMASNSCEIKNNDGVFAGGDCVTGPATVIKAIAAGKIVSANIDSYLGFNHKLNVDVEIPENKVSDNSPMGRVNMKVRPADERKRDFNLMGICCSKKEATQEASRCLRCDKCGFGKFKGGRVQW